jgi:hypothetical protein
VRHAPFAGSDHGEQTGGGAARRRVFAIDERSADRVHQILLKINPFIFIGLQGVHGVVA